MGEGMGTGAVERKLRPYPDTGNHVSDLAYDMVRKDPSHIVLYDGVENAVDGHRRSEDRKHLEPREAPRKDVHGCLRREGTHENGALDGRLRICIGQPRMEGQYGGIKGKSRQDKVFCEACVVGEYPVKDKGARLEVVEQHPRKEQETAEYVHKEIPVSGIDGPLFFSVPDKEHRREGHSLPKDKEGQVIPGEDCAQ
ncbi:MAG: hypothetical protein A4E64_00182 [Syntrophorhabdus sp. PtaU1.Bin058]|nr:MAG: hypothetical protein A4E64_00182 [Syntrophorhabdus sp. PtaU1.Bin058]